MSKIVLLVVGAAWAAVLLPPLLRSRVENRPNSSVVDFRRRLSTLQRTVPARGMSPMRSMARPLAPSPARGGPRTHGGRQATPRLTDVSRSAAVAPIAGARQHRSAAVAADVPVRAQRPSHGAARRAPAAPARQLNARERMRQRRQNVLFMLIAVTAATAFLAASTRNSMMVYAFVLASVSLAGFCYKLVQIRRQGDMKAYGESWFRAA
jgi:hypothetical protein